MMTGRSCRRRWGAGCWARRGARERADPRSAPTAAAGFAADVLRGLKAQPKFLEPKHFYDELGSALFTAIYALPDTT